MTKIKPTKEVAKDGFRHLKNGSIHKKKQQKFKNTPTGKVPLIDGGHQKSNGKLKHQNGNQKEQSSPSQSKSPKGSNKHSNSFKNLNTTKSPKIKVEEEQDDDDSSVDDINEGISVKEEISAPEDEVDDDSSSSETEAVPDIFGTSLAEETDEDDEEFDADSDEDEEEDAAAATAGAENKGVKMFKGLQPKVEPKESSDDDEDDDDDDEEEDDDDDDSSDEVGEHAPGLKALLGDSIADESDDEDFKGGEEDEEDEDSDEEVDQSVNSSNATSTTDEDDDEEDDDDDEDSSDDDDEAGPDLTALLGNSIAEDSDDEDFEGDENDDDEDDEDEDMSDDDDDDNEALSPKEKVKVMKAEDAEEEDDDDDDGRNESFDSTNHKSDDEGKPARMSAEEKAERNLRTIFIGNVPKETEMSRIKSLFKKFGPIDSIRLRGVIPENPKMPLKVAAIKKKFHSKSKTICAFVTFKSVESVELALTMNGKKLDGNFLRVDYATASRQKDNKRSVFLGNLPFAVEDNEVWEAFKDCGKIESVRIIRDRKSGVGRGFGYINFESADGAVLAMDMNGTTIHNRELRVKVSTPEGKKKQREEKKGKKRQLAENATSGSPKKPKTDVSETAQVAKHNSVNAERRTDKKKRSQGEKQRIRSESTSPQGKGAGKFQGQKADNKKKSKPNKHAKKKMQMAAKLLAKPKKPSAN